MLPKEYRINTEKDIKRLVQKGKTFFLAEVVIKYLKNDEGFFRFGFVTSTKVDKKAVTRNLLKRRLRSIAADNLGKEKIGYDLIIIANKKALKLDFVDLKKQLNFAFSQIRNYNNKRSK